MTNLLKNISPEVFVEQRKEEEKIEIFLKFFFCGGEVVGGKHFLFYLDESTHKYSCPMITLTGRIQIGHKSGLLFVVWI